MKDILVILVIKKKEKGDLPFSMSLLLVESEIVDFFSEIADQNLPNLQIFFVFSQKNGRKNVRFSRKTCVFREKLIDFD